MDSVHDAVEGGHVEGFVSQDVLAHAGELFVQDFVDT